MKKTMKLSPAALTAIGIGVGIALGVAFQNLTMGLIIGLPAVFLVGKTARSLNLC